MISSQSFPARCLRRLPALALAAALAAGCSPRTNLATVVAQAETTPIPHAGDAADDPAIWVDRHDPARSTIIGTDKLGGLAVYDLAGAQIQYLPDGNMNNVDLRADVLLGGQPVALVTAGNRSTNHVAIYRVDPATRMLVALPAELVPTIEIYGSCMYRSAADRRVYVFVNSKDGTVEQWELLAAGERFDAKLVRTFDVGTQTEGCVADDQLGRLYIGEEQIGIWRYGAEPGAGSTRTLVDSTGAGRLTSNIEGLALTDGPNGGYLIASSQGDSSYALYRRGDNTYVGSFAIGASASSDGVSATDGLDATAASLGPRFPHGMLVVQDGANDGGNQNFKLVPLEALPLR